MVIFNASFASRHIYCECLFLFFCLILTNATCPDYTAPVARVAVLSMAAELPSECMPALVESIVPHLADVRRIHDETVEIGIVALKRERIVVI